MQAKLVAFWITHDERQGPTVAVRLDQFCAKRDQPFDLSCLLVGIDMNVKVHTILSDLALRYPLEE
jgi:hypothetical protein